MIEAVEQIDIVIRKTDLYIISRHYAACGRIQICPVDQHFHRSIGISGSRHCCCHFVDKPKYIAGHTIGIDRALAGTAFAEFRIVIGGNGIDRIRISCHLADKSAGKFRFQACIGQAKLSVGNSCAADLRKPLRMGREILRRKVTVECMYMGRLTVGFLPAIRIRDIGCKAVHTVAGIESIVGRGFLTNKYFPVLHDRYTAVGIPRRDDGLTFGNIFFPNAPPTDTQYIL